MSIAEDIVKEAGKRNRSRDWYRGKLMEVLSSYQGKKYDCLLYTSDAADE